MPCGVLAKQCVQKKQTCSVGGRPTGVKARGPLAWVASAEDNKADEADRQSHLKGWSASRRAVTQVNPQVASKQNLDPEAEPPRSGQRQHGMARADRGVMTLRRGGRDSTVIRTCRATGEALLVPS